MLLASQAYAVRLKAACIAAPSLSTHAHTRCSRTRSASHGSPIALTVTCSKQSQLPQELIKARQLKSTGLATSAVFIGTALTVATTQGVSLPSVPSWLIWGLLAVSTGVAGVLVVAAQEGLQYELHNGRLYIQWGSPSEGVPVAPEAIQVSVLCLVLCEFCILSRSRQLLLFGVLPSGRSNASQSISA